MGGRRFIVQLCVVPVIAAILRFLHRPLVVSLFIDSGEDDGAARGYPHWSNISVTLHSLYIYRVWSRHRRHSLLGKVSCDTLVTSHSHSGSRVSATGISTPGAKLPARGCGSGQCYYCGLGIGIGAYWWRSRATAGNLDGQCIGSTSGYR